MALALAIVTVLQAALLPSDLEPTRIAIVLLFGFLTYATYRQATTSFLEVGNSAITFHTRVFGRARVISLESIDHWKLQAYTQRIEFTMTSGDVVGIDLSPITSESQRQLAAILAKSRPGDIVKQLTANAGFS